MVDNGFETAIKTRIQRQEGRSFEQIWPMRCNDTCLTNKSMMILGILLVNTAGTMSYEPPTPPAELPTDIVNTLNGYSPDQLQDVARYAEALAEHGATGGPCSKKSRMTTTIVGGLQIIPDDVPTAGRQLTSSESIRPILAVSILLMTIVQPYTVQVLFGGWIVDFRRVSVGGHRPHFPWKPPLSGVEPTASRQAEASAKNPRPRQNHVFEVGERRSTASLDGGRTNSRPNQTTSVHKVA